MRAIFVALIVNILVFSSSSYARNDINDYSIQKALKSTAAKAKLNDIQLFFGDQAHGKVIDEKVLLKVNKKTNAFNKTDREACEWVFLSAVIALQKTALKKGGNAVVNIKSNYKNNLTSSNDTFQCGVGSVVAGVALTGEIVIIE